MMQIQGKYGIAEVFTDNVCTEAYTQILNIMNQCWARNADIKFMPDVSPGA